MHCYVIVLCLSLGATSSYAMHHKIEQLCKMIDRGCETREILHKLTGNHPAFGIGWRAMHILAANGEIPVIHLDFKKWHHECDARTGYGWNPLHVAAACGNNAIAVLMIHYAKQQGKDILTAIDLDGRPPAGVAKKFGNGYMYQLLSNENGILRHWELDLLRRLERLENSHSKL